MAESIQPVSIVEETRHRYLHYALSVIGARALPDVRDGLKPVQRRILYTMYHDLRLHFDGRPAKCAKITGAVTGNYHPHGTVPAYEALVRLAQNFMMRVPLIRGQGNFGSVDGDPPAQERYTEAKLAAVADRTTLRKIYEERTGSIKVQGEWKPETHGKREQIVITSIPYGVNKGNLELAIGEIINSRKVPQLVGLTNETNEKDGLRIALD